MAPHRASLPGNLSEVLRGASLVLHRVKANTHSCHQLLSPLTQRDLKGNKRHQVDASSWFLLLHPTQLHLKT